MAVRVAVGNHKGGSGKTAEAINLAAALAEAGKRVLLVDLDPQANASRRLGRRFDHANPMVTVSEVIQSGAEGVAADAIVSSAWPDIYAERISIIPSRFDLENRISEAAVIGAVGRLNRALSGADDDFDVTLIDCPPSLGHLTQLALAAAESVLCAVEPEYDSVDGAVRLRDFVNAHAAALGNPSLRMLGYVINRVRQQVGAHKFQLEGLADTFGAEHIWSPYIPERAPIKDAADGEIPLRKLGGKAANELAAMYAGHATIFLNEVAA